MWLVIARIRLYTPPLVLALVLVVALGPVDLAGGQVSAVQPVESLLLIWLQDPAADLEAMAEAPLVPLAREGQPRPFVLARAGAAGRAWLESQGLRFQMLDDETTSALYCLADARRPLSAELQDGEVLYADALHRVVRLKVAGEAVTCGLEALPLEQPVRLLGRQAPHLPDAVSPMPQVQDMIDQVHQERLLAYVEELSGERPALINGEPSTIATRYTYADAQLRQATRYVYERLARLELDARYHQWKHDNTAFPPNVVAEKRGLSRPDDVYILGAHLDSTSQQPQTRAPGADDNASGAAAVLLAAELLAPYHFEATLRFVLFTGEEQGLWGSAAYAQSVSSESIMGVLNLDMIGWDRLDGPDLDLHADSDVAGSVELGELFAAAVEAYDLDLAPAVYLDGTNRSDHASFWNEGFPAVLLIENFRDDPPTGQSDFNAYYHTVNDRSAFLSRSYLVEMARGAVATLAHLAGPIDTCYWADADCSGQVDVVDVEAAANRWRAAGGDWNYHLVFDRDRDGLITVVDVQKFAGQWGWQGPPAH